MSKVEKRRKPRSKSKPQSSVPAFLLKTYEIIEDPEYHDIVCWNEEGDAFIVKNVTEFSDKILPKYFKHNNFASFVRQLNMYDFHKIRHESNENEFQHPSFKRDHKELLAEIKRKTPDSQPEENNQLVPVSQDLSLERFQKEANHFTNELQLMKNRQNDLEKASKMIFAQNSKLLKENKLLWTELMRNKEKYEKKIEKMMLFVFSMMHQTGNTNKAIGGPMGKNKSILDDTDGLSIESEQSDKEEETQLSRIDNKKDHEKFYKQLSKYFQSKGNKNNIDRLMDLAKKGYFENTNPTTPMLDDQSNLNFDMGTDQMPVAPNYGVDTRALGRTRSKRNAIKQTGGLPDDDLLARGLPSKAVKTEAQSYPAPNLLSQAQNPLPAANATYPLQTNPQVNPMSQMNQMNQMSQMNQMNQMNQINPVDPMYNNTTEPYMEPIPLEHTFSFPSLGDLDTLKSREPSMMQPSSAMPYQQQSYNYYGNPQPMANNNIAMNMPIQTSEPQMNWLPEEPDALLNFTKPDEAPNTDQNLPLDQNNSFTMDDSIGPYSPGPSFLPNTNQGFNFGQAPDDIFGGR